ncbi:Rep family protein [Helicobacter pylori]|uniref:Rep family protein n=1 Tax=Helicobacter pylori TaxID=210 RepID=UPI00165BD090|nr:Rep family protein [Helicobacter pylori]
MPKKRLNSAETHSKHDKYNQENAPYKAFGFIIYPESAVPNFVEILNENFDGSLALSPLHDKDLNDDGSPKKPHYHAIIVFDKKQRPAAVKKLLKLINQNEKTLTYTNNERVKGAYEYFTHSNPKDSHKYQYDKSEIQHFKGFDIDDFKSKKELKELELQLINEIEIFIQEQGIVEYADLFFWAMNNQPKWAKLLRHKYTRHITALITSQREKNRRNAFYR